MGNRVLETIERTEQALANRDPLSVRALADALALTSEDRALHRDWLLAALVSGMLTSEEAHTISQIFGGAPGPDGWSPDATLAAKVAVTHFVVTYGRLPLDRIDLTAPADPSALPLVRHAVRRLAAGVGLDAEPSIALQVAVGEAVNYAIDHASASETPTVSVRGRHTADGVVVEVTDHSAQGPEQTEAEDPGLTLMHALVDDLKVERHPSGTQVRLTVSLRPSAGL